MRLHLVIAVLTSVAMTNPTSAQPPRDTSAAEKGTGVISGTVFAADGRTPLAYAQVTLGGRDSIATTDARGHYEFKELPAGRYTSTSWKNGYLRLSYGQRRIFAPSRTIELKNDEHVDGIDFKLPKGGAITVRVTDDAGRPLTGINVEVQQYRPLNGERQLLQAMRSSSQGWGSQRTNTDDRGEARVDSLAAGEYYVKVMNEAFGPNAPRSTGREGTVYLDTYYPGTPSASDAAPIVLGEGMETSVSVTLLEGRSGTISGVVKNSEGVAWKTGRVDVDSRFVAIQPDGTFVVNGVPAGDHVLRISPGTRDPQEYGRQAVHTSGDDLSVELITAKPWTMRGRLIFEGSDPPRDLRPDAVHLGAGTVPNAGYLSMERVKWNPDWTFEISNLVGPRILRLTGTYRSWSLKRVTLGDRDVSYAPIDPEGRLDVNDVRVVMTKAPRAVVSGGVVTADGEPVTDYSVVIFPANPLLWGIDSLLIGDGRPDQQGRFEVRDLAPGRYFAVATPSLDYVEERDPSFLSKLKEHAVAITLDEGDVKTLSLTFVERW